MTSEGAGVRQRQHIRVCVRALLRVHDLLRALRPETVCTSSLQSCVCAHCIWVLHKPQKRAVKWVLQLALESG